MEHWWHETLELLAARRVPEAIAVTRAAAATGSVGAKVRLARFGEDAGVTQEEADQIVEQAILDARPDDERAHWNLFCACDLMLGLCEPEEKYWRAQRHLELYAKASGDPTAALAVARRYANGTAVLDPNMTVAVDWYFCACALGSEEAQHELRVILRDA